VAADERRKTQMGKLDRVIARDPVIGVIGRAKTYRGDAEKSKHILIMTGKALYRHPEEQRSRFLGPHRRSASI
jgi:hypothetical protein